MKNNVCRLVVLGHNTVPIWTMFINNHRLKNLSGQLPKTLKVDLIDMNFIAPYHVVSLACLIEEYYQEGVKIEFIKGNNAGTLYLNKLGFFEYWETGFDRSVYHNSKIKTALCLWKLHKEMLHPYVIYAQQYFQNHFFNGKDLDPLNVSLAESFNNVMDHSHSEAGGYVFTQYYQQKRKFIISLCDFGNGIPNTVNEYLVKHGKKATSGVEAVMLALKKGFSTQSTPTNRGFGLDNISSIVKALSSEMLIVSNNAYIKQLSDGSFVKEPMNHIFPGTQIVIHLKTDNLRILEKEEITDSEFFL